MSDQKTSLSKRFQWRAEWLIHSLVEAVASVLPGSWVFRAGECLGVVLWHCMPRRQKVVLRNLRIACAGSMEIEEIRALAKSSFARSVANLLSVAHTARLPSSRLGEVIEVENIELLEASLAKGKGVVLLLAHMGNWELLSRLIHLIPEGAKIGGMYRPLNNPYLDERIRRRREADGSRMFSKRDPFHQITGFLRDGGVVGILADQRTGRQGDWVEFFGRSTRASPLPGLLARRTKADVIALSLVTVMPGKWKAILMPVTTPPTTQRCMTAMETLIRISPVDMFWLQERWRVKIKKHRAISDMFDDQPRGEKPYRVLLWLAGVSSEWRPFIDWLRPNMVCDVALLEGQESPSWLPKHVRQHRIPKTTGFRTLMHALAEIDGADLLPLDLILDPANVKAMRKAAARHLIQTANFR